MAKGRRGSIKGGPTLLAAVITYVLIFSGFGALPGDWDSKPAEAAEPFSCNFPSGTPWAPDPTSRITVNSAGGSVTDLYGFDPAVSSNGRFVSFTSYSAQHVPGDTNGLTDVFVRDRQTNTTSRVSVSSAGQQGNRNSYQSSISGDGRYVAFTSEASNLAGGDGDFSADFGSISVQPDGVQAPGGFADFTPGLSIEAWVHPEQVANWGRIVDFGSGPASDNFLLTREGTTNNLLFHIYHGATLVGWVRATGVLELSKWQHYALTYETSGLISIYKNGTLVAASGYAPMPRVVYRSGNYIGGSNWDADDSFGGRIDEVAIYRYALPAGKISGHYQARHSGYFNAVNADSPYAYWRLGEAKYATTAIDSGGLNIHATYRNSVTAGDDGVLSIDQSNSADVFIHDRQTGQTSRVSVTSAGAEVGNFLGGNATVGFDTGSPQVTGDGRYVSFDFFGALEPGDTNGNADVYVRDRDTDANGAFDEAAKVSTTRVSVSDNELQGNDSQTAEISPDGRFVTFTSFHPFAGSADANGTSDIYLRDRLLGGTHWVSPGSSWTSNNGNSHYSSVSADGRYVAFASSGSNLVSGDNNGYGDIFVRDTVQWTSRMISVTPSGQPGNNESGYYPSISPDGKRIVFTSVASNLVADDTNGKADVFIRDLNKLDTSKATTRVSMTKNNAQSAGPASTYWSRALSADARYAAFSSSASDLIDNDANNLSDVFMRDLGPLDQINLSPLLGASTVAQSDESGLEQFYPYSSMDLGSGTAYTQLRTGNLVASFRDTAVPGMGLNANVRRVYNSSRSQIDTGAGAGWTLGIGAVDVGDDNLLSSLLGTVGGLAGGLGLDLASPIASLPVGKILSGVFTPSGQVLELTDEDGTTHRFVREGPPCSHWRSPPGVDLKVREIFGANPIEGLPDAYELIRPDGVVYRAEKMSFAGILPTTEYRIASVTDRRANKLTYAYERFGPLLSTRLRSITHNRYPNNPLVRLDYTALGDLDKIVTHPGLNEADPATGTSRSWERQIDYDIDPVTKRLNSVTENNHALPAGATAAQRTTTFTYSGPNYLNMVKDGRNNSTGFGFNAGRLSRIVDRRSNNWFYSYTSQADGSTDAVVDSPVGSQVTYKTSARGPIGGADERIAGGNIISITDKGHGEPASPITTTYGWAANRLVSSKDGAGNEKAMEYNDLGLLTKVTQPAPNATPNPEVPDAVTGPVVSKLEYRFPAEWGDDPAKCTQPASSGPVSTDGYCFAVGDLTRATFADNHGSQRRITDFNYDAVGNMAKTIERAAPDPAIAFDSAAAPGDRATTYAHYSKGALKSIDGPRTDVADLTEFGDASDTAYGGYDRTGQPKSITDAAGKTQIISYTLYGQLAKIIDREARTTTAKYDERNNLVAQTDPAGHSWSFKYDANDNQTEATSPRGTTTATAGDFTSISSFDQTDLPTQLSTPGAAPSDPRTLVKASYADDGRLETQTSARDAVTNFSYWPNRLLKSTDAPAQGTSRAVTDYFYDSAGRTSRVVGPVGNAAGARPEVKLTYNPDSSVSKQEQTAPTTALATTDFFYNAHGEQAITEGPRTVNSVKAATATEYDRFGQPTKTKRRFDANRYLEWTAGYDLAGNQVSVSQPTGAGGQITSTFTYDALNRLSAQTADPTNPGHTVAYLYDGEGNQTRRTDKVGAANARVTDQTYNSDYTPQITAATSYNSSGVPTERLLSCNFATGAAPTSGYDADQNLLETRTVSVTGAGSGSDAADCDSAITQRSESLTYGERGWISSATQQVRSPDTTAMVSRTDDLAYEPDGRVDSLIHKEPGGAFYATAYDYTAAGWVSKTTDWRSKESNASYLASGAPALQSLGSATATATFDWFAEGSPKTLTWKKASAGAVVREHKNIAYEEGGLRTSEDVSILQPGGLVPTGASATYGYDLLDRLVSWTSPFLDTGAADRLKESFTLDDAGNITQERTTRLTAGSQVSKITSSYSNNRLNSRTTEINGLLGTTTATDSFGYSGLGQETQRTNSAGASFANSYNPMGHTKGYDDQAASNSDVTYVYSTDDQMISRHEPAAPGDRARSTLYFYHPVIGNLSEETDGAGNTLVRYLNDGDGQALAQQGYRVAASVRDATDTAGTWKWLLQDVNGDVATHVLDNQDVAEQSTWDPYGRPEKAGSSQTDIKKKGSTLGFQGAITDKVTGNLVLGPRQYDTSTARFITPDVFVGSELDIGLEIDPLTGNRYLFAAANPVAYWDDGHWPSCFCGWKWRRSGSTDLTPGELVNTPAPPIRGLITVPNDGPLRPLVNVPSPLGSLTLVNVPTKESFTKLINVPDQRRRETLHAGETNDAASRRKKIRLARELGGIPRSAQPTAQGKYGKGKPTRWWEYRSPSGKPIIVVEHPDGSIHVGLPKPQSSHRDGGVPRFFPIPGSGHVGEDLGP